MSDHYSSTQTLTIHLNVRTTCTRKDYCGIVLRAARRLIATGTEKLLNPDRSKPHPLFQGTAPWEVLHSCLI